MTLPRASVAAILPVIVLILAAAGARSADADADRGEAAWLSDLAAAKAQAAATGRPVLILFTGSDWCPPCIALQKEVLKTKAFGDWAADHAVLLYIDFPHKKKLDDKQKRHNEQAKATYKPRNYPTFVVLNPTGAESSRWSGYPAGAGVEKWLEQARPAVAKAAAKK